MKTLNVIAVVESTTLFNAVEVSYKDIQFAVTAMATVENCGANAVVVGTPVSKYFGTEVRMHNVARDINTGRFVSIKDTMDAIVDVAIEQGYDLLGFDLDDSDEDSQSIIVTDSQSNMLEKEEVITVTEESVMEENSFIPEPIILNESKAVPTATRLNGGFTLRDLFKMYMHGHKEGYRMDTILISNWGYLMFMNDPVLRRFTKGNANYPI